MSSGTKMQGKPHVGLGLIGLNKRGLYLAKQLAEDPRVSLEAVCDIKPERCEAARVFFGDQALTTYTEADAFVNDPNVDAIIVATPDHAHAENGLSILRAGKHLFLEKPMAQTIDDCDALIEAWQQSRSVFMVGLELRYCSLAEQIKQLVDDGEIGDVRLAYAVDNVSVGGQYFYHSASRRKEHEVSLVLQKGTHTLDLMNWFIGAEPVRVYSEAGLDAFGGSEPNDKRCRDCDQASTCPYYMPHEFKLDYGVVEKDRDDLCVWAEEVDVEDNAIVTVRYDNGAKLTYIECHFTPDYNRHFTLIGTKGRIYGYYDNAQNFVIEVTYRHSKEKKVLHPEKRAGGHGGGDAGILRTFLEAVVAGEPMCRGVMGARDSAAIAIAADEAVAREAPVRIPRCPATAAGARAAD